MKFDGEYLLIADVEASCWQRGEQPAHETQEIIEIGLGLINPRTGVWAREPDSYLVRPMTSQISAYCTNLTGLTAEVLERDDYAFQLVIAGIAREWEPERYAWASWGDFDLRLVLSQCENWRVPYPFSRTHLDLSALFALMRGTRKKGMAKALGILGLPLVEPHHRAASDVASIGQIVPYLFNRDWKVGG